MSDALGMKGCGDARRTATPIESTNGEPIQVQSIGEVDHILSNGGLFGHARGRWIEKARTAVAANPGNDHAIASLSERRCDKFIGVSIVWESVQQDDRMPIRWTTFEIGDIEDLVFSSACW